MMLRSRLSPRLNAHLVSCSCCDVVARIERGDATFVDLTRALSQLEAAGWRRIRGSTVCPACAPPRPVEPRIARQRYEIDPSPARQALAQLVRDSSGEQRKWAKILLAEWLDEKK